MKLKIGLTGGIGSGKSLAAEQFAALGVPVCDADVAARSVVMPGSAALRAIGDRFGADMIAADGSLDRARLRRQIFSSAEDRKWLEALLHPLILEQLRAELQQATGRYTLLVSPLLLETGQHALVDRVLVVDVPEELQLQRTMARDANSEEQVAAIMAAQMSRAQRLAQADDVLDNSGGPRQLAERVAKLHRDYCNLAERQTAQGDASS